MKGLVIDGRWIDLILAGTKTWEMPGNAKPLHRPVLYKHPRGAVISVRLERQPDVVAGVRAQATGF